MQHVIFSEIGGPEVLKVAPFDLPPIGPEEVGVSIEAIGGNWSFSTAPRQPSGKAAIVVPIRLTRTRLSS